MIQPFPEAVQRLDRKTPVGALLRSAQWAEVPLAIREKAFFSATIHQLHILQDMQDKLREATTLGDGTDPFMDRGRFVKEMKETMAAGGLDTGERGLTNPASTRRLRLIYDFQMEDAAEYGRHKVGQSPELLDAFPAQELVRIESRKDRRDWRARWQDAGGQTHGGRMIARKNDPVWRAISRFGRPWPPFDFGSGMGVADVERDEAERLGVIQSGEQPEPEDKPFNEDVKQSVRGLSQDKVDLLERLFSGAINIANLQATLS
jgi:hypothetical protein